MQKPNRTCDWQLLTRYLGPQRTVGALMAALPLCSTGLEVAGPRVVRVFINAVAAGAAEAVLIRLALIFIGLSLLTQALRVLAAYWSERVAWTASNALRGDLTAHLLRLDAGFHKDRTPGELIERVDGDVSALGGFFSSLVVHLIGSLLLLGGILISLFVESATLGLVFTLFAAVAAVALSRVRDYATPWYQQLRERSAAYYGYIGEAITAAEDLRASGAVPHAISRWQLHRSDMYPATWQAEVRGSLVWVTAGLALTLADALAYGLGGGLFRSHAISLGTVYMVVAYATLLARPVQLIRTQLQNLQRADAAIGRVLELLDTRSSLRDGAELLPPGPLSVTFDAVSFHYDDDDYTLRDLSLRLAPGRSLGILGRTGSGKTTIARLLARHYDPQEGRVRLGGVDLRHSQLRGLRSRIGMVTQEVQLFDATLRANITFFDPAIADEELLAVLGELGLGSWVAHLPQGLDSPISPASLSAGEAQLLALARVFFRDPGLVILDEASSRLDQATEALVSQALQRLLAGRTAIIIAHRLATLAHVDQVLILEEGRVLECGDRAALAADPASHFARLAHIGLAEVLR